MRTYQTINHTLPIAAANPLQMAFSVWNGTTKKLRERQAAERQEQVVAALPAHLRQDVGALDSRPSAPRSVAETLEARQQTLESMWLRYF
jgi:hypothetical protein